MNGFLRAAGVAGTRAGVASGRSVSRGRIGESAGAGGGGDAASSVFCMSSGPAGSARGAAWASSTRLRLSRTMDASIQHLLHYMHSRDIPIRPKCLVLGLCTENFYPALGPARRTGDPSTMSIVLFPVKC